MEQNIPSLKKTARLAGLLYLIWAITGVYGLLYIPSKIIVRGDAVTTANKILANEFLFRTGIINDLISITIGVFLVLVLYRLFKQVNERQAKLMVTLLAVTIPVTFIMDTFNIASLMIFKGEVLKTFELSQRQDLAMLFPDYQTLVKQFGMPFWILGEISIMLWLLIKGVKDNIPTFEKQ